MRNIDKYLNFILLLCIINIIIITNAKAATNPYNQSGPYGINCTWYAWKMANERAGVILPGWGNAKEWYNDAKNAGYIVGTEAKANSIIVWGGWTSYGHVGYVESVEGNILHVWDSTGPCIDEEDEQYRECMANGISEESDKLCKANAKRIACKYTISPDEFGITGYIYLDYVPNKENDLSTQNNNSKEKDNTVKKSNNSYLSDILLSAGNIKFDKEVYDYTFEVEHDINEVAVNATLEDEKAIVVGTGNYKLSTGLNIIKLVVTAEDSSIKEYTIRITRKENVNKEIQSSTNTIVKEVVPKKNYGKTIFLIACRCLFLLGIFIYLFNKRFKNRK